LLEYLETFNKFLEDYKAEVITSEMVVRSKVWNYAGTLDLILKIDGKLVLYDIKSGVPTKSSALQTIAYKIAYEENTGNKIKERGCIQLFPDKYKIHPHKNKNDENVWKAICIVSNSRKEYI